MPSMMSYSSEPGSGPCCSKGAAELLTVCPDIPEEMHRGQDCMCLWLKIIPHPSQWISPPLDHETVKPAVPHCAEQSFSPP